MARLKQNQSNRIREQFGGHPFYRLCQSVFYVFQQSCPTMMTNQDQLFVDASRALDHFLQSKIKPEEVAKHLWTDTYREYREYDESKCTQDNTKSEVAMLFYCIMYALSAINDSKYRCTLHNSLHETIYDFYGKDNHPNRCLIIEPKLRPEVNKHTASICGWMDAYRAEEMSLTTLIENTLGGKKNKAKSKNASNGKNEYFPTINYVCNDKEKVLRIDKVQKLMVAWNMIEDPAKADDFHALFNGSTNYRLNLNWNSKTNTAVLHFFLQRLFEKTFVQELSHGKPKAVARNILRGKNPSGDKNRLKDSDDLKIEILIFALDPTKPFLQLEKQSTSDSLTDYDINFLAEQLAKEGCLGVTKDLNKSVD